MPSPEPISLGRILAERPGPPGRAFLGARGRVAMADLVEGTSLAGRRRDLAGRSVLLRSGDQLEAALALVELDGLARRIVLCPPDLKPEHLAPIVAGADVDAVVCDPAEVGPWRERLPQAVPCGLPLVPEAAPAAPALETEWILLTSGTTGVPKMVVHTLPGLAGAIGPASAAEEGVVWSTFYDIRRYGGLQIFLRAVLGTGSLVLSSAGEPVADFLRRLAEAGVTHISGTPSHWRRALMSPAAGLIAPCYVRLSGEIADQAILDHLRATYPAAGIGHAFASTEAGVGFEVRDEREGFPAELLASLGSGIEMKVEDGSLRIRSSRSATRYLGAEEPLVDEHGFVDTGDMVERRGERWHFVGRRGGIINVGGLKVHPEEVEAAINRHARVRMSLVRGRKSPVTGTLVVADVVLAEPADEADQPRLKDEIVATCRAQLERHKVPVSIRFVPALAVTQAGKLARLDA